MRFNQLKDSQKHRLAAVNLFRYRRSSEANSHVLYTLIQKATLTFYTYECFLFKTNVFQSYSLVGRGYDTKNLQNVDSETFYDFVACLRLGLLFVLIDVPV